MSRIERNSQRLANLIFSKDEFTKEEIVEEFRQDRNGDIVIDGQQNVSGYLDDLRQLGLLRFRNGRFFTK